MITAILRRSVLPLVLAVVVLAVADAALGCPNCKDSLAENDPTAMGIVQGYFWSIILMLSTPFLLLLSLSVYFYVLVRRARRQASLTAPASDPTAMLPVWNPSLDT